MSVLNFLKDVFANHCILNFLKDVFANHCIICDSAYICVPGIWGEICPHDNDELHKEYNKIKNEYEAKIKECKNKYMKANQKRGKVLENVKNEKEIC